MLIVVISSHPTFVASSFLSTQRRISLDTFAGPLVMFHKNYRDISSIEHKNYRGDIKHNRNYREFVAPRARKAPLDQNV